MRERSAPPRHVTERHELRERRFARIRAEVYLEARQVVHEHRRSVRERFEKQGLEVINLDPAAFAELIKFELEVFAKLAKDMNLKM